MSVVYTVELVVQQAIATQGEKALVALKWFEDFQKSKQAWPLVEQVLSLVVKGELNIPDASLFQILRTISHQMQAGYAAQLGVLASAKVSLLEMLKGCASRISRLNLRRLCIALAAAAVHDETWASPIDDFVRLFSGDASHFIILAELLSCLPEEIFNSYVAVTPDRRKEVAVALLSRATDAFTALFGILNALDSAPDSPDVRELRLSVLRAAHHWIEAINNSSVGTCQVAGLLPDGAMSILCNLAETPLVARLAALAEDETYIELACLVLSGLAITTKIGLPNALPRAYNFTIVAAKLSAKVNTFLSEMKAGNGKSAAANSRRLEILTGPFLGLCQELAQHCLVQLFVLGHNEQILDLDLAYLSKMPEGERNPGHMGYDMDRASREERLAQTLGDENIRNEVKGAVEHIATACLELLVLEKGSTASSAALDMFYSLLTPLMERVRNAEDEDDDDDDFQDTEYDRLLNPQGHPRGKSELQVIRTCFKPIFSELAKRIVTVTQYDPEYLVTDNRDNGGDPVEVDGDLFESLGHFRNLCSTTLSETLQVVAGDHDFIKYLLETATNLVKEVSVPGAACLTSAHTWANFEGCLFALTTLVPRTLSTRSVSDETRAVALHLITLLLSLGNVQYPSGDTLAGMLTRAASARVVRWSTSALRRISVNAPAPVIPEFLRGQIQAYGPGETLSTYDDAEKLRIQIAVQLSRMCVDFMPVFSASSASKVQCEALKWDGESACSDSVTTLIGGEVLNNIIAHHEVIVPAIFQQVFIPAFSCDLSFVESRIEIVKVAGTLISRLPPSQTGNPNAPGTPLAMLRELVGFFGNTLTGLLDQEPGKRFRDPPSGVRHLPNKYHAYERLYFAALNCIANFNVNVHESRCPDFTEASVPPCLVVLNEQWPLCERAMAAGVLSEIAIDAAVNSLNGVCSTFRTFCLGSNYTQWVHNYLAILPVMFRECPNVFILGAVRTLVGVFGSFPLNSLAQALVGTLLTGVTFPIFERLVADSQGGPTSLVTGNALFSTTGQVSSSQYLARPGTLLADNPDIVGMSVDCVNMALVPAPLASAVINLPCTSSPTAAVFGPTPNGAPTTLAIESLRIVGLLLEGCDHAKVLAATMLLVSRLLVWISVPPSALRARQSHAVLGMGMAECEQLQFKFAVSASSGLHRLLNSTNIVWPQMAPQLHLSEGAKSVSRMIPEARQLVESGVLPTRTISRLMYLYFKTLVTTSPSLGLVNVAYVAFHNWLHAPQGTLVELKMRITDPEVAACLADEEDLIAFKWRAYVDLAVILVDGVPESFLSAKQREAFFIAVTEGGHGASSMNGMAEKPLSNLLKKVCDEAHAQRTKTQMHL